MRKKNIFWMLQIIMVLLLSATMAYAQQYALDVDPQIDELGQLIDENLDTVNPALVCIDCQGKDEIDYLIFYSNCTTITLPQQTPITQGIWNAFDRDAAFTFSTVNATLQASWDNSWISTAGAGFTGRSYIGYCQNATPNYLFAICNCVLKTQFLPAEYYVFEVEVIGDGVYWTNRNLSLFNDAAAGVYDEVIDEAAIGGNPYGPYEDNVIRFIVGEDQDFFCDNDWWADINASPLGWAILNNASDWSWAIGYAAVKDYIYRNYTPDFSQSTCTTGRIPFNLPESNGVINCPVSQARFNGVNAKVLRTWPVQIFEAGYPVLAQTPYLYLDLPTMIYNSAVAQLCDEVYVFITVALPFQGICSNCCNLPMCSCKQFVGTFGCDPEDCEETPQPSDYFTKCLPYITNLLDDGWWDFVVVANMSESTIAPVLSFYANGQMAEYQMAAIPAMSSEAAGLVGDISDYIAANYPAFPLTDEPIFAEVTVEGTTQFDALYLTFNPLQGTTSYLARCAPCGTCTTCD